LIFKTVVGTTIFMLLMIKPLWGQILFHEFFLFWAF